MNIHLINIQYKSGLENKCTTLLQILLSSFTYYDSIR